MAWTKETMRAYLLANANREPVVRRALLAVFKRQTPEEQTFEATKYLNGVGFNGNDGPILSIMAKGVLKYGHLTPKQSAFVAKRIVKYAAQLAEIANKRAMVNG